MYTAVYEKVPQGYIAWIAEMPGVLTQGKTKRETQENLKDALKLMLEVLRDEARKETRGKKKVTRERFSFSY
ncbi:hypothetical protein A3D70_00075 [Candidatus Adlerbacteria bacterium RIFCSPHIGHO2_02_FULL_54_18]|uniref:HicB-like antitoxin of toxin-antitoxin system domain-containing protein n=2 Tax=Candidatus Adleribacteriota TaxID=1752736 RepID=A0A1F4Y1M5_9BACT|nr:MAG: hypothetical protein A2949_01010 [Candidatus Adlerbacteria bacterium RIFCSPLOWO2_01_FULL_54_21b]OGC87880.1 MAG: hypothetical protein A3D70_00075 [Candidatus Adlerbacteria bacterium RIFCSPHIGHO2_02_FULL_54_18]